MTVTGVVAKMKRYTPTETPRPEMIVPYMQNPYLTFGTMQFVVRSNFETSALLTEVQRAMAAADPTIPVARRALGAGPREILQLILGECLGLTGVGIAFGFALTAVAGLGMRPLLFDVSPFDPITLIGSMVVIAAATIAASLIPAASAARVEPRAALED